MPRTARAVVPGIALHVIQRGNNRGRCFFRESDRTVYLNYLRRFAPSCDCLVHAYCLMSNHVHLLVTPRTASACGMLMKRLGQHYVLACYRYIELNPVRAGMAAHPHEYRWSSYRANAKGEGDSLLAPHPAYLALAESGARRLLQYRGLFDEALDSHLVEEIRSATRNGRVLGAVRNPRGRPSAKTGTDPIFSPS